MPIHKPRSRGRARHEPIPVVFDFVGSQLEPEGGRSAGLGGRFDEFGFGGKAPTHTLATSRESKNALAVSRIVLGTEEATAD